MFFPRPERAVDAVEHQGAQMAFIMRPVSISVVVGAAPTSVTVDVAMHFTPLVGFVPLPRDGGGPVATAHAVMLGVP